MNFNHFKTNKYYLNILESLVDLNPVLDVFANCKMLLRCEKLVWV